MALSQIRPLPPEKKMPEGTFEALGFSCWKSLFTPQEVAQFRHVFTDQIFSRPPQFPGDRPNIRFDALVRYPELRRAVTKPQVVAKLRELLGKDFLLLPEASVFDSSLLGGWHRDTGSAEASGHFFHYAPGFKVVNVAFYFQDNDPTWAGGLDIVPGSHVHKASWWEKQKSSNRRLKYVLSHLDRRHLIPNWILHGRKNAAPISSKSGDVVAFHTHCVHRPSHPRDWPLPASARKLALFLICSPNDEHARKFVDFIRSRPDYEYLRDYKYPRSFVNEMNAAGIGLYDMPIDEST